MLSAGGMVTKAGVTREYYSKKAYRIGRAKGAKSDPRAEHCLGILDRNAFLKCTILDDYFQCKE